MENLKQFLIWSTVINHIVLCIWFAAFAGARNWLYRLHGRWFRLAPETFDAIHYGGMTLYKILVLAFNVVPLVTALVLH